MSESMTPNIEALLHGYVSGKFYDWPLLRDEVAALIKERDALKQYKQGVDGIIHHLIESDSSLDHEWAGDKHGWGFAFEWIKWIVERLRAEQRIPPGMTPELLTLIANVTPHTYSCASQYGGGSKCDCLVSEIRGWAAWLRKQAEPGTAPETPTESSSSPEAKTK